MTPFTRIVRSLVLGLTLASATLLSGGAAFADKIHLKDGRVLEGKVVREGTGFVFFNVKVGTVQNEQMFMMSDVVKIERDDPAPKTDEAIKAEEAAKSGEPKKDEKKHAGATRVAFLNFGGPSEWQGKHEDMVGVQVNAQQFRAAIPLLEKDKVDVVVVRVKSGGGYTLEVPRFNEVFDKEYKPRFRLVAWIESGISAAAMSPWVIEEFYFFPQGSLGACTEFSGNLNASKGMGLEMILHTMEKASVLGKKDPKIMRAMQIMEPLSVDIDENGIVHWRQDENGQILLNRRENVYTMVASEAVKTGFAKGIAGTKEELMEKMGIQEYLWAGQAATDSINKNIADSDHADKHTQALRQKYQLALQIADALPDKERRGVELARAKRFLQELRNIAKINKNFEFHLGLTKEWFDQQEEIIKRIANKP